MSRVLVTGANGFVGRALCSALAQAGQEVRAAVRSAQRATAEHPQVVVGDIGGATDWRAALRDVDVVIHTAARVHVLDDSPANEELYTETNARGTQQLARAAADAGVRRLVLLSSIKVNGEGADDRVYRATDVPHPEDAYGRSKLAAERYAFDVARERGLELVVVRAPLVYGPGVRANFLRLMHWVWRRRALPLAAVRNRRSMIGLGNLCDLLCALHERPRAAGKVWLAGDGDDLSTPELVRRIAGALEVAPRLVSVPTSVLRLGGWLVGKQAEIARLCGSLQVDTNALRDELNWVAPWSIDAELVRTARWFREQVSR